MALLVVALFLPACQTEIPEIPEDLSQPEFFQRAQDAADENEWEVALHYYETFIERFPEDEENVVAAEYEIAFIHYKMEEYRTSRQLFEEILDKYEEDEEGRLPAWVRILSEKILDRVNEEIAEQEEGLLEQITPDRREGDAPDEGGDNADSGGSNTDNGGS
jgi:outer membrane protein assembly factor BamD (BamD/ComL family)